MGMIEYIIFYICLAAALIFAVLLFTYPLRLRKQRKAGEEEMKKERRKTKEELIDELLKEREEIKEILKKKGIINDPDIDSFWLFSEMRSGFERVQDEIREMRNEMRTGMRENRSLILFSTGVIIAAIIAFGMALLAAVT